MQHEIFCLAENNELQNERLLSLRLSRTQLTSDYIRNGNMYMLNLIGGFPRP